MAFSAIDLGRDLRLPIDEVRSALPGSAALFNDWGWADSETIASLPEMRRGGVAVALVKVAARIHRDGNPLWGYRTGEIAYAATQGNLAYYRVLEAEGEVRILTTGAGLAEHMGTWSDAEDREGLPVGLILGMEGADAILWPEQVHGWWASGLRVVSLSHYGVGVYAHGNGTGTEGGLLPPAAPLLREMDSAGMVLDLTHTSDQSVREALDAFAGPLMASHQNCRVLCPGERQFPDELLQRIIERDGVIGVTLVSDFLRDAADERPATLDDFADHVDHVNQLAGDSLHSAIGGDTDGQGGAVNAPEGIDTIADYFKIADVLDRRGYSAGDIENVMYRNWQRFYQRWLPAE